MDGNGKMNSFLLLDPDKGEKRLAELKKLEKASKQLINEQSDKDKKFFDMQMANRRGNQGRERSQPVLRCPTRGVDPCVPGRRSPFRARPDGG